jgi:hypothetical protein
MTIHAVPARNTPVWMRTLRRQWRRVAAAVQANFIRWLNLPAAA